MQKIKKITAYCLLIGIVSLFLSCTVSEDVLNIYISKIDPLATSYDYVTKTDVAVKVTIKCEYAGKWDNAPDGIFLNKMRITVNDLSGNAIAGIDPFVALFTSYVPKNSSGEVATTHIIWESLQTYFVADNGTGYVVLNITIFGEDTAGNEYEASGDMTLYFYK